MKRLITVVAALTITGALAACGGSGSSGDATVQATRPSSSSSAAGSSSSSSSSSSSGEAATAAVLPDGFPLPEGAQAQGSAMTSDTLAIADYTVPEGKRAYEGLVTALPAAG